MRSLKSYLPAVLLGAGILVCATASYATMEFSKKEKKACVFCHVKAASKELNDAGKYYKDKKTLDGYQAPAKKG